LKTKLSLIAVAIVGATVSSPASLLSEAIEGISHEGELRLGAIKTADTDNHKTRTISLGGKLAISTKAIEGISATATFLTTNALFGKDNERSFLDSNANSYSIVGEAYLQGNFSNTIIKAGRQILDTPYADSDDIGMIPNSFEGYTLINHDLEDTRIVLASLEKWAGFDAPQSEKFSKMQTSGDPVLTAGLIYEGLENTTLQAWHYSLDDADFNYAELSYEADTFSMALQYTEQGKDNSAYGMRLGANVEGLSLVTAYNKVEGVVVNGFGGGPFFSSSEDHTIAEENNQEAILYGVEYSLGRVTFGATHLNLDIGENETDYLATFQVNKNHTLDLIYSDMYDDGNRLEFFANYQF